MSDHKLIKVTRYSKSFRQNPRYIRKRVYKNFDEEAFKKKLEQAGLDDVLNCVDVDEATDLLVDKISAVLDEMAPIRTIQTRMNYVPWLSEKAKDLQLKRNQAQETASRTDEPEDWRVYRSLRNQFTSKSRADKEAWEKKQLDEKNNSATEIWKCVKNWLGGSGGETPTQLCNEGKLVTSPDRLSTTMNKFFS